MRRPTRTPLIPVLVLVLALGITACSGDDGSATTTVAPTSAPAPTTAAPATTTTAAPATTTTAAPATTVATSTEVQISVELAVAYEKGTDGSCAGTTLDGEDFGYLAPGAEIVVGSGDASWSGEIESGEVVTNDAGLETCLLTGSVPEVPADLAAYEYQMAADPQGITATLGDGDDFAAPPPLLYPHGVPNGLGYQVVDWQLYPTGIPLWYSDVQMSALVTGIYAPGSSEDFLFGIGFAPETASEFTIPFDGFVTGYGGPRLSYNSIYPEADLEMMYSDALIGSAPHQFARQGVPGENDVGIWIQSTVGNLEIPFPEDLFEVTPIGAGNPFGIVGSAHEELVIVPDGIEVVLAFSAGGDDGYVYELPPTDPTIFEYFPYLASALEEPPQVTWEQGLTVVVGPECPDCDTILGLLDGAPEGLPVHILGPDDRIVRMLGIVEFPHLAAAGPGSFDKATVEAADALDEIEDMIDRACGWIEGCA
jgi:hypothetical protein